jgi:hypothetical protein
MLPFARVVALPDPKIVIFPAESIVSYGWVAGYVIREGMTRAELDRGDLVLLSFGETFGYSSYAGIVGFAPPSGDSGESSTSPSCWKA